MHISNIYKDNELPKDSTCKKFLQVWVQELDNQILLNRRKILEGNGKISVSENRKNSYNLKVKEDTYKVFPVYYPVGNGIFNIDKSIEDIRWIMKNIERK